MTGRFGIRGQTALSDIASEPRTAAGLRGASFRAHPGRILGASMVGSRREHLTHLIAWAIEQEMTVERALAMHFYHPVIEEALLELNAELRKARPGWASGWLNPARTLIRSAVPS